MKKRIPKLLEPDTGLIHYAAPIGLDQATICGITDWIAASTGVETNLMCTCNGCRAIANHFGYKEPHDQP